MLLRFTSCALNGPPLGIQDQSQSQKFPNVWNLHFTLCYFMKIFGWKAVWFGNHEVEGLDAPFSNSKVRCKPFSDSINSIIFHVSSVGPLLGIQDPNQQAKVFITKRSQHHHQSITTTSSHIRKQQHSTANKEEKHQTRNKGTGRISPKHLHTTP